MRAPCEPGYFTQHHIQMPHHARIYDSQFTHADSLQKPAALRIIGTPLRAEMMQAIQLDGQPPLMAIEIQNVTPDWVLTAKLQAGQTAVAQGRPKQALGRCCAFAQCDCQNADMHGCIWKPLSLGERGSG